ncbi:tetratricopeptide repeat protein [bacterium]|nr:tetratricopeptide repeat protein [bacterium]
MVKPKNIADIPKVLILPLILILANCQLSGQEINDLSIIKKKQENIRKLIEEKQYTPALEIAETIVQLGRKQENIYWMALGWAHTGEIYQKQKKNKIALEYYERILSTQHQWSNDAFLLNVIYNIGLTHKQMSNLDLASSYFHEFLEIERQSELKHPEWTAKVYDALGNIQRELKEFDKSLRYHFKCLKIVKPENDFAIMATSYNNLGHTYMDMGKPDSARFFINNSIRLKRKINSNNNLGYSYHLLGKLYYDLDQTDSASIYLWMARKLHDAEGQTDQCTYVLVDLAKTQLLAGKPDSALFTIESALNIAQKIDSKDLLALAYRQRSYIYEDLSNLKGALRDMESYEPLREEILDEVRQHALSELEIKYHLNEAKENLLVEKERLQLSTARVSNQRLWILVLVLAVVVMALFVYILRSNVKKERQLKEQEKKLLKELHHRVKNNLSNLSGSLAIQVDMASNSNVIEALENHRKRLDAIALLHEELFDPAGSERKSQVDFTAFVEKLCQSIISASIWNNKIDLELKLDKVSLPMNEAIPLGMMVNEIITNAVKHAFAEVKSPSLEVILSKNEDFIIEIKDNGIGFKDNILPQSTSVGMAILTGLASQLDAKLLFESKSGLKVSIILNK